jgi:microcompartment protein CcmK/EutM
MGSLGRRTIWLNGPFGVGKSAVARAICGRWPGWRLFDPETVGSMLVANIVDRRPYDFQDLVAWRQLVPLSAAAVAAETGQDLVVVQTVTDRTYWATLSEGLQDQGLDVAHVVLDCADQVLRQRIAADSVEAGALDWRLEHIAAFDAAREWLRRDADLVIDAADLSADDIADRILSAFA